MEKRMEPSVMLAAALLFEYPQMTVEKVVRLLALGLYEIDGAECAETKRSAQRHAELKSDTVFVGR
jgi:hypothetical protein